MNDAMQLSGPEDQALCGEMKVIGKLLDLEDSTVLELGCGAAQITRAVAERTNVAAITAVEIDSIQHEKNLKIADLPGVTFKSYGAQEIDEADEKFDCVMMFKSLHHVPGDQMFRAWQEIERVLKPGGIAYISEPVFEGALNHVMRLFHDEEKVRQQAFEATQAAVEQKLMQLEQQFFFRSRIQFDSFDTYKSGILGVTHTRHQLSPEIMIEVERRFMENETDAGFVFESPNRVDLLRKPLRD